MVEKPDKDFIARFKDVSVIILCWAVIVFLALVFYNNVRPAKKVVERTRKKSLPHLDEVLNHLVQIEKNIEAITSPERIDERIFAPLSRIQASIAEAAVNMVEFSGRLTSATAELQRTVAGFQAVGRNLDAATRTELIEAKLYEPVNDAMSNLSTLLKELRGIAHRLQTFQDELAESISPALSHISKSMDDITTGIQSLTQTYGKVGENLSIFTQPQNLNKVLSLREAAKFISMPLSKSAAEVEHKRLIVRIDRILDEDMLKEGFNVELERKAIVLDDFNAFQRVRIDAISLTGKRGKLLEGRWKKLSAENLRERFAPSDYVRWAYCITALQHLSQNQIQMTEDLEQILVRLPKIANIAGIIDAGMLRTIVDDADSRRLKKRIAIRKIYPRVRKSDLPLPLKIPLTPFGILSKEIPLTGIPLK